MALLPGLLETTKTSLNLKTPLSWREVRFQCLPARLQQLPDRVGTTRVLHIMINLPNSNEATPGPKNKIQNKILKFYELAYQYSKTQYFNCFSADYPFFCGWFALIDLVVQWNAWLLISDVIPQYEVKQISF